MRTYTIAPSSPISLKAGASVFVGAFGTIWLFIEPLGLFGLVPAIGGALGIASYLLMLLAALLVLLLFFRSYRWYKIHDLPFVHLTVASASDGITYSLRVAKNMQIGDFFHDFLQLIQRGPGRDKVKVFARRYDPVLQVQRSEKFVDVDSNFTVGNAGLVDGDVCQVRGAEHERYRTVMFSISREASSEEASS